MSWKTTQDAIQAAIAHAAGSSVTVIWKDQDADQPALPYIAMRISGIDTLSLDAVWATTAQPWAQATGYAARTRIIANENQYQCSTAGVSAALGNGPAGTGAAIPDGTCVWSYIGVAAGNEVALDLLGNRQITLQVEVYTDPQPTVDDNAFAIALAEQVRSSLVMPGTRSIFSAAGVSPLNAGKATNIPTIAGAGFRGRAILEIPMLVPTLALVEYVTYIAQSFQTVNATDGATTISQPYSAP